MEVQCCSIKDLFRYIILTCKVRESNFTECLIKQCRFKLHSLTTETHIEHKRHIGIESETCYIKKDIYLVFIFKSKQERSCQNKIVVDIIGELKFQLTLIKVCIWMIM